MKLKNSSPARRWWKRVWRRIRVCRREGNKAIVDTMIYGTGAVFVPKDGSDPHHIPVDELKEEIAKL